MKLVKLSVIHFQPLEKYPPVKNILEYFSNENYIKVDAYSVTDLKYKNLLFATRGVCIYRTGILSNKHSSFRRYLNYIKFNLITVVLLIFKKPDVLLCYETISIFPAYIYKKLFPSSKLYIHFHEYTSLQEYNQNSHYIKWLYRLENKLYNNTDWISHTNFDRLNFFRTDHATIKFKNLEVMPNYPPKSWYKESIVRDKISTPIKFVYVGALSLDSMYTWEFAEWVKQLNGAATWDIYSGNYQENAITFIKSLNCPFINFRGEISYHELPKVLRGYEIGLVLYNGHIPNYVYNAPNKLFEYHSCGLDVWFSDDIKTSLPLETLETYPKIAAINFKNLGNLNLEDLLDRKGKSQHFLDLTADKAFEPLLQKLQSIRP